MASGFLALSLLILMTSSLFGRAHAICGKPLDEDSTYGKKFLIPYPEITVPSSNGIKMTLNLVNPSDTGIDVTILEPNAANSITVNVDAENTNGHTLLYNNTMTGTNVSFNSVVVVVESANDFGLVVTLSRYMDGYTAIPVASWGKNYEAVTYWTAGGGYSQIVIVTLSACEVTVRVPAQDSRTISLLDTIQPEEEEILPFNLPQEAVVQIQRDFDLTGTSITSTEKIAILCGNTGTSVAGSAKVGAFMEQLPSKTAWATQFVSYLTPEGDDPRHDLIRILALEDDTSIYISSADQRMMLKRGHYFTGKAIDYVHYIQSNRPLVVVKFTYSDSDYPTMSLVMPTSQFLTSHKVLFPKLPAASLQQLVVVTRNKYKYCYDKTPNLDFKNDYAPGLLDITVLFFDYEKSNMLALLECNQTAAEFAAFVVIKRSNMTFQSPLAYRMADTNPDCQPTTTHTAGDHIDNDCDGKIDEDMCSPHNMSGSDDCASIIAGDPDVWGYHFSFLIPEHCTNVNDNTTSLLIAKILEQDAEITVETPLGSFRETHSMDSTTQGMTIYLPQLFKAIGSTMFSNITLRVTSDVEISVTLVDLSTSNTCQSVISARLLPEDVLGTEYFIVTYCVTNKCQFQVTAIHDGITEVKVLLKLADGQSSLTFNGSTYNDKEEICITLSRSESFQLQVNTRDLSGTHIVANKPIAVLSGGKFTTTVESGAFGDGVMEQMPPVTAWGYDFFFFQSPTNALSPWSVPTRPPCTNGCKDFVTIVCHVDNTEVHIGDIQHILPNAGDVLTHKVAALETRIHSDKPVMVVQVTKNAFSAYPDSSMSLLTPISQYGLEDVLLQTGPQLYLMLAAEEPADGSTPTVQIGANIYNLSTRAHNMTHHTLPVGQTVHVGANPPNTFHIGGQIYYVQKRLTSFHPLAYMVHNINRPCVISKGTRGDGIDNDCDGDVDEEQCIPGTPDDTDNDGMVNEDCTTETPEASSSFSSSPHFGLIAAPHLLSTSTTFGPFSSYEYDAFSTTMSVSSSWTTTSTWSCFDDPTLMSETLDESSTLESLIDSTTLSSMESIFSAISSVPDSSSVIQHTSMPSLYESISTDSAISSGPDSSSVVQTTLRPSQLESLSTDLGNVAESLSITQSYSASLISVISTASSALTSESDVTSSVIVSSSTNGVGGSQTQSNNEEELCSCNCPANVITTSLQQSDLDNVLKSIQQELYVDKKEVSKTKRKFISAPDHRPSAQAVGWLGVGMVAATLVGLLLFDLPVLAKEVLSLIRSCTPDND